MTERDLAEGGDVALSAVRWQARVLEEAWRAWRLVWWVARFSLLTLDEEKRRWKTCNVWSDGGGDGDDDSSMDGCYVKAQQC